MSGDNCPTDANPGQEDADMNNIGDACDMAGTTTDETTGTTTEDDEGCGCRSDGDPRGGSWLAVVFGALALRRSRVPSRPRAALIAASATAIVCAA